MISCAESAIPPQAADPNPGSVHGPAPTRGPEKLTGSERMRLRNAAHQAKRRYPGPVGELVSREILSAEDFGFRFGGQSAIRALVDDVLKPPAPAP